MPEGILVGLKKLYFAILTTDDANGFTYQAPVAIPGARAIKVDPKTSSESLYADDGPLVTSNQLGDVDVELETAYLTQTIQAALLGHSVVGGVMTRKHSDISPYVALGYERTKENGSSRFVWLYKGRFEEMSTDDSTKEDKVKYNTPKIKAKFIRRIFDAAWSKTTDQDDPTYVAATGTTWFDSVGTADTTPPTISTYLPANNATGVAVGATINWTFSEAIDQAGITAANFVVFKDTDGTVVAGALTYDAATFKVTLTPSAALTALTAYRAVVTKDVQDLSGNKLAANSVTKFTTA
ncbi:MAG: major tail protein [Carboxydocellales bacterium]